MVRIAILALALSVVGVASAVAQQPTAEQRAACDGDFKKLCSTVMPGGGRILKCLSDQKEKVSDACRKALGI
jgi:Cysteine rich repeat